MSNSTDHDITRRRRLWLLLPKQLRALPADLAAILGILICTNIVVFVPVINDTPLRVVIGLLFVLFVPGYAFIAALFPEAGSSPTATGDTTAEPRATDAEANNAEMSFRDRGIDGIERVALSFGLSIAIVPLIGLALNFTPFGIRLVPILVSLSAFTAITTAVAAVRRWRLPQEDRFRVPYRDWIEAGKQEVFAPDSTTDAVLNVALALAILLAISSVVFAIAVPPQGEQFTEFYILTEDEDDELVASGYPDEFTVGETESLYVGVGNNEYETIEYTIVVQLQEVHIEDNDSQVVERAEVDRWTTTVTHNDTQIQQQNLTVSDEILGDELRLAFLLYTDDPPAQPTRESAYRDLHLWISVSEPPENEG